MAEKDKDNNSSGDLLFEIGTEELPAAAAISALGQAGTLASKALAEHRMRVDGDDIKVWVTPRRIAIRVEGLPIRQSAEELAERGPAVKAAFDEGGKPTKAAEGFAKAKGIAVDELVVREFKGQEFVFAVHMQERASAQEVIPDICREILESISFPKTMRWDAGDMRFSRPVRWLLTKYGDETIKFEAAGLVSDGFSRGHRFLGEPQVKVDSASSYREQLAASSVIVDQEERRRIILEGLAAEASQRKAEFIDPAGELEEVLYLVENPTVASGSFSERHLRLPDKVLITAMQSHQRYFPLIDGDGFLVNGFLYVMNGDPAHVSVITEGNERILEGRIEDAEFSFDKDLDRGIENMAADLGSVVFHRRLGSLADKSERIAKLVDVFSKAVGLDEKEHKAASGAARLAKADQVSVMVQEFPALEGYIGSVYTEMEGFPSDICKAIAEQYMPVGAGADIPETRAGAALAICDKTDNLMGAFSVNELPTGSRDPYGLRRAALGVAEISREYGFDFDLTVMLEAARKLYLNQKADVEKEPGLVQSAFEFVSDRIQHRQVEKGIPVEVMEAARAAGQTSALRLIRLAEALDDFRGTPKFEDFHTAYFRCSKIAAKAGSEAGDTVVDESLFDDPLETELYSTLQNLEPRLQEMIEDKDYMGALAAASEIRPVVDKFFDEVMVMAEDDKVRSNRLSLVKKAADILVMLGDPIMVAAAPKQGEVIDEKK